MTKDRLGIGFVGSGFVTGFHLQALVGVRDADVCAIASPTREHTEAAAAEAKRLGVGEPAVCSTVAELAHNPMVDAIWICSPNDTRVAVVEEIVDSVSEGAHLLGVACEKPLARNVAEAKRMVELIEQTDLLHGYLENQCFAPALTRGKDVLWRRAVPIAGRPYLARAAEEHSGPHKPWFWSGSRQGGGVLNDMLCHSYEAGRFLLTGPDEARDALTATDVSAQIESLKWSREEYAARLKDEMGVDYTQTPAEDFARASVRHKTAGGTTVLVEATTSWSFVGPGLRLRMELLGPEYSMQVDTLTSELQVFLSRRITGSEGEDLVEKQNAEQGLMPIVPDEAATYGYVEEDRHMVKSFLAGEQPSETWHDGLAVTEVLMACYMSAEEERVVHLPEPTLDTFIPAVARDAWQPS